MKKKLISALTQNMGYKIVAVFLAVILWLVVVNIDDPTIPDTIANIPITVTHEETITEQGKVYTIIGSATAYVKVEGPRSFVDNLTVNDFVAIADFSTLSIANAVTVKVDWSDSGKSKSRWVDIVESTTTIGVELEDIQSKSVPVQVNYIGEPAEGYVVNSTVLSVDEIQVTAPQSILRRVYSVVINVDVTGMEKDFSVSAQPKIFNYSGEEILQTENTYLNYIEVKADVEIFKSQEVEIKVNSSGNPAPGYEVSVLNKSLNSIIIKGREEDVDQIQEIELPSGVINIEGATENQVFEFEILDFLPEGIYLLEDQPQTVTITAVITKQGEKVYQIPSNLITIKNLEMGYTATIDIATIDVALEGTADGFDILTLKPFLDFGEAQPGRSNIVLKFETPLPTGVSQTSEILIPVTLEVVQP